MNTSIVCFLRLFQCVVSVVAMLSLCGIFRPVKLPGQPSPVLETSYSVNAAVLLTSSAAIYSGILCAFASRASFHVMSPSIKTEMAVDVGLTLLLFVMSLVLMDSDDLHHCHESINVHCGRFVASIAFTVVAALLYGLSSGLALFGAPASTPDATSVPMTPVGPTPKQVGLKTPMV